MSSLFIFSNTNNVKFNICHVSKYYIAFLLWHVQPLVPEYWNGEGKGYRIQYKSGTEDFFSQTTEVRNENANSYTFTNLEEWTEYNVRVAAFNQVGTSAYSSVATDRTIESGK